MTEASQGVFDFLRGTQANQGVSGYVLRKSFELDGNWVPQHGISPSGNLAFLVPIDPALAGIDDRHQLGFTIDTFETSESKFVRIECNDAELERQFAVLIDDLLSTADIDSGEISTDSIMLTVAKWRRFFSKSRVKLDASAQIGLLAELLTLKAAIEKHGVNAVDYWFGPEKARHDFVGTKRDIEVKATLRHSSFTVVIHGRHQLEPRQTPLALLSFQFELASSGITLGSVVSDLLSVTHNDGRLISKLRDSGLPLSDIDDYMDKFFKVRQVFLHEIDDDFPNVALSGTNANSSIHAVQFDLNLEGLPRQAEGMQAVHEIAAQL